MATATAGVMLVAQGVSAFERDIKGATGAVNGLDKSLDDVEKRGPGLGQIAGTLAKIGVGVTVAGITAVGGALAASVASAMEAQDAVAGLNAVLKNTGPVTGVTADMATELANSLQKITKYGDEDIIAGQTLLATFTEISSETFPAATETMLDMATVMNMDLPMAARSLGKALEDPIEGTTALRRYGLMLTDAEEEEIKTLIAAGKKEKAQALVLDMLSKKFKGAAAAAGDTFSGKLAILNNTFDELKETIGTAVLPALTAVADTLINVLNSPAVQMAIQNIATWLSTSLVPAVTNLVTAAGKIVTGLARAFETGDWSEVFTAIRDALADGWETVSTAVVGWASKFWDWLTDPTDGAISKVAAVLGSVGQAILDNWPAIKDKIIGWAVSFWDWLTNPTDGAIAKAAEMLGKIGTAIVDNAPAIWEKLTGWANSFWGWLVGEGGALEKVGTVLGLIGDSIAANWPIISEKLTGWASTFWDWLTGPDGAISLTSGKMTEVANKISEALSSEEIRGIVRQAGYGLGQELGRAVVEGIGALFTPGGEGGIAFGSGILNLIQAGRAQLQAWRQLSTDFASELVAGLIDAIGLQDTVIGEAIKEGFARAFKTVTALLSFDIGKLVGDMYDDISKAWNEVDWKTLGGNIVDGLIEGIGEKLQPFIDAGLAIFEAAKTAWDNWWGSKSPSTVMIALGYDIMEGLRLGIERSSFGVNETAQDVMRDALGKLIPPGLGWDERRAIREHMAELLEEMLVSGTATYREVINRIVSQTFAGMTPQVLQAVQQQLQLVFAELGDMLDQPVVTAYERAQRFFDIAGVFGALGMTATTMQRTQSMARIKALKDELMLLYDQGAALGEQQRILEEIEVERQKINAAQEAALHLQEQQQQLQFLQQQAELLEVIRKYNLNPAEILGGMQLGLGADLTALTAAMIRAMNAMLQGAQGIIGMQHGGAFTVPPGYPHDSYRVGLTSGERVVITPQGFAPAAGGVNVTFGQVNISDGTDWAVAKAVIVQTVRTALRAGV